MSTTHNCVHDQRGLPPETKIPKPSESTQPGLQQVSDANRITGSGQCTTSVSSRNYTSRSLASCLWLTIDTLVISSVRHLLSPYSLHFLINP
jgi:hypothetical protein